MFKFGLVALSLIAASVDALYRVDVQKQSVWTDGSVQYFSGQCELHVDKSYQIGQIVVEMILDTPTSNLQIWKLKVTDVSNDGTVYLLDNKYEMHAGVETVNFIFQYSSNSIPTGECIVNLPSPGQSTTTTSSTTSSTTTSSTTRPQSTTTTTTTPSPITSQSTGSGVYQVPVVKVQDPWPTGSSWSYKAKCTFDITSSWTPGTLFVDLMLNQETSNLQIWLMNVISDNFNGIYYELVNKYWVSPGLWEFDFIVTYNGDKDNYPIGSCSSRNLTPGSTQSTSTTTPTSTTTTTSTSTTTSSSTTTTSTGTTTTTLPPNTPHNYGLILEKSILFYEAQQSGALPSDHRITWRGDSALSDIGINGEDLTGGWYDAGDGVKFNLPMSASATNLAVGLYKWRDAYAASQQLQYMYKSLKWPLDYFLKCWRSDSQIYYAQVGNGDLDHAYWGRPEDMTMDRPPYYLNSTKRGSDVAGGTAAALAAGAIAFKNEDPSYSSTLLVSAESLYAFAKAHPGTYNTDIPQGAKFYRSSEYKDEMCVSAALLYNATQKQQYLSDSIDFYNSYSHSGWAYDWDDKTMLCDIILYEITKESRYKTAVENFITSYMPGGSLPYTPGGLAWRLEWGPLRYSANAAFIALLAADVGIGNAATYRGWAESQIHYMLGDNNNGFSYVIGYGASYPLRPHHRGSSCRDMPASCTWDDYTSPGPNPQVLEGALVGGPGLDDSYEDRRDNFRTNEVACDYNAGFQSAVAGLLHFAMN